MAKYTEFALVQSIAKYISMISVRSITNAWEELYKYSATI